MSRHPPARRAKFRQAAFFYLHVAILYEATVWVLHAGGRLDPGRGPIALWLIAGAAVAGLVFWALWWKESIWVARVVWLIGALRIPVVLEGAFLPDPDAALAPAFWYAALAVILVNLWLLARAGWDL
ncbi:MAG: hypothetical protein R3266_14390 [Gemmatimonadota bacterium]|nr:hypothetical protein [Gemmatimonadota bacterium]